MPDPGGTAHDWLDQLLRQDASGFAPPAPDLRAGVASALALPRPHASPLRRVALAAAVAAGIALVLTLAIAPARTGVAEFFGLIEGYEIEFVESPSTPVPRATAFPTAGATSQPTAEPTSSPTRITTIAEPVTAEEAEAFLGAPVVYLDGREPPQIFVTTDIGDDYVILRYADLDLWQTRGIGFFGKGALPGTVIETPLVAGSGGYWVEGPRTIRFSRDEDATTLDVSRNSLIWRGATLVYRIEADLPLAEVLAIAETLP